MGWLRETLTGVGREVMAARGEWAIMKAQSEVMVNSELLKRDPNAFLPKADMVDPFAYEGLTAFGYREKLSLLDFNRCKLMSFSDPILAAILQTRINQVAAFAREQVNKYRVGFKVTLRDQDREPTRAEQKRIDELTAFLNQCGVPEDVTDQPDRRRRDGFEQFLRKVTRDSLTYDQMCFEVVPRKNGLPYEFIAVDAATIRILPDDRDLRSVRGDQRNMLVRTALIDTLNPHNTNEVGSHHATTPRYCQMINGIVQHLFDGDELAFGVRNPRSDILAFGYGFSEIEMLVTIVTAHMNAESYNRKFFSQGSTAKGILTFEGSVPRDQLQEFRRMWHMQATGIQNAWKTPIIAPGKDVKVEWTDLQKTNNEMEYGKWMEYCIKTMCAVYQIDPIEINFDISRMGQAEGSNSQGLGGNADPSERLTHSQDKGLKPLLRFLEHMLNVYVVQRIDPDFTLEFVGLGANSEDGDLDKIEKEVKTYKTLNEVRREQDLPDIKPFEEITSVGDLPLDTNVISAWAQGKQAEAQAKLGEQQAGADGKPGDEKNAFAVEGGEGADEEYEEPPDYDGMNEDELQQELQRHREKSGSTNKSLRLRL